MIRKVLNVDYHRYNSKTDSMNTKASTSINRGDSLDNLTEEAVDKNNQRRQGIASKEHDAHDQELETLLRENMACVDTRQSLAGVGATADAIYR